MQRLHHGGVTLVVAATTTLFLSHLVSADSCDDSYLLPANSQSPSSVLSVSAINGILTEHNRARRNVNPAAKEMPMLQWNQTLADFAQEYMNTCVGMVHSSNALRSNASRFGWSYIGENLAAGSSTGFLAPTGGERSTFLWNEEVHDWTYSATGGTCLPNKACGHYTQNIWAKTTHVGCGYTRCESLNFKNYWSCVYGPGGNYRGQAPYEVATASQTATCQNTTSSGGSGTPTPGGGGGGSGPTPPPVPATTAVPVAPTPTSGGGGGGSPPPLTPSPLGGNGTAGGQNGTGGVTVPPSTGGGGGGGGGVGGGGINGSVPLSPLTPMPALGPSVGSGGLGGGGGGGLGGFPSAPTPTTNGETSPLLPEANLPKSRVLVTQHTLRLSGKHWAAILRAPPPSDAIPNRTAADIPFYYQAQIVPALQSDLQTLLWIWNSTKVGRTWGLQVAVVGLRSLPTGVIASFAVISQVPINTLTGMVPSSSSARSMQKQQQQQEVEEQNSTRTMSLAGEATQRAIILGVEEATKVSYYPKTSAVYQTTAEQSGVVAPNATVDPILKVSVSSPTAANATDPFEPPALLCGDAKCIAAVGLVVVGVLITIIAGVLLCINPCCDCGYKKKKEAKAEQKKKKSDGDPTTSPHQNNNNNKSSNDPYANGDRI